MAAGSHDIGIILQTVLVERIARPIVPLHHRGNLLASALVAHGLTGEDDTAERLPHLATVFEHDMLVKTGGGSLRLGEP